MKSTVTRVHFEPGAFEPPHTHPYDVILVPVTGGPVDTGIGDSTLSTWKAGDVPPTTSAFVTFITKKALRGFSAGRASRIPNLQFRIVDALASPGLSGGRRLACGSL